MNDIFLKLIDMSISASVIITVIIVLRILLKKIPKKYICILWALVAIRLLCPISIETTFSAFNIVDDKLVSTNNIYTADIASTNKTNNTLTNEKDMDKNVNKEVSESDNIDLKVNNTSRNEVKIKNTSEEKGNSSNTIGFMMAVMKIIWIVGIIALTMYGLISTITIKRKVRASINVKNNIYICDYINTPFIFGIIRPKIYVQSSLSDKELEFVIAHEQAHIDRRDYIWKPLGFIILIVYCFNPLCWIAYALLCRDIEVACDEKVIRNMDNEKRALYSETLLKCSVNQKLVTACPVAFGEVGVKKRIKNILNYKKPTLWIVLIALLVCTVVAVCFLTDPVKEDNRKQSTKNKSTTIESIKNFWKDGNDSVVELLNETGTGTNDLNSKETIKEMHIEDELISKVLNNEEKFYNIQLGENQYLKDYKYLDFMFWDEKSGKYSYDNSDAPMESDDFSIDHIAQVDMDSDGKKEVILEVTSGTRLILHTVQNQVYLYSIPFREMKKITIDGRFDGSSSAAMTYVGKLRFDGEDCFYDNICMMDELEENNKIYTLNGKKVKKKKVVEYLSEFSDSDEIEWFEYKKIKIK